MYIKPYLSSRRTVPLRGTETRDFFYLWFFHQSSPFGLVFWPHQIILDLTHLFQFKSETFGFSLIGYKPCDVPLYSCYIHHIDQPTAWDRQFPKISSPTSSRVGLRVEGGGEFSWSCLIHTVLHTFGLVMTTSTYRSNGRYIFSEQNALFRHLTESRLLTLRISARDQKVKWSVW